MTDDARCVHCGAPLVGGDAGQFCPACLLQMGLPDESGDSAETTRLTPAPTVPVDRPAHIGPYRLLETLGEGGMGIVYLAEQSKPIRRRVALKVIKLGMDTRQVVARFEAERQALALMDHPHIARVFDAGATEEGRPYFAMEYVAGRPITEYCDRQRLSTRARLELFAAVCGAVQHAHQKGVIHRDLKPTNILVTEQDGRPVPKVIDFGVAKATHQHLTARTLFTEHGILIGTPEYMSPEQADGAGLDLDTRTDIYSLGVVLYELLVGAVPFEPAALRAAGYGEILRILREEEPTRPSTKLSSLGDTAVEVASRRQTTVPTLARELSGDLDWVALKALEKDRSRRYASASELAADIGRHLADEPLVARPPSAPYRLLKFSRRHRLGVALTGAAVVALTAGTVTFAGLYSSAEQARIVAARQRYWAQVRLAHMLLEDYRHREAADELEATDARYRSWEWNFLQSRADAAEFTLGSAEFYPVTPNVDSILSATDDGRSIVWSTTSAVAAWDLETWQRTVRGGWGSIEAVSPDGRLVLVLNRSEPGAGADTGEATRELAVREVASGRVLSRVPDPRSRSPRSVPAFSHDGALVAIGGGDGVVHVWTATGELQERERCGGSAIRLVRLGPSGTDLAVVGDDGSTWLCDFHGRQVRVDGHSDAAPSRIIFSADGRLLAVGTDDGTIRVTDVPTHQEVVAFRGHTDMVTTLAFDSRGERLVSGSLDGTVRLWSVATGEFIGAQASPDDLGLGVDVVTFAPAGRILAAYANELHGWPVDSFEQGASLRGEGPVEATALTSDGRLLATVKDTEVLLWSPAGRNVVDTFSAPPNVRSLAFDGTGRRLAAGSRAGDIQVWELAGPEMRRAVTVEGSEVRDVVLSSDGQLVAAGLSDGTVRVWNVGTGEQTSEFDVSEQVNALAFASDTQLLVGSGDLGAVLSERPPTLSLWDLPSGTPVGAVDARDGSAVGSLALSPDGRFVAAGGTGNFAVSVWRGDLTERVAVLPQLGLPATVAFGAGGSRLFVGTSAGALSVWDHEHEELLITLPRLAVAGNAAYDLWVSDTGDTVAVNTEEGVRVWAFVSDRSRRMKERVAALFEDVGTVELVVETLRSDGSLSAADRSEAVRLARQHGDDPQILDRRAWNIVSAAGRPEVDYVRAEQWAEAAVRDTGWEPGVLRTLALAQVRVGRHSEALVTIERAMELRPSRSSTDVAVSVLARLHLGQLEEVRPDMEALLALETPGATLQALVDEARQLWER